MNMVDGVSADTFWTVIAFTWAGIIMLWVKFILFKREIVRWVKHLSEGIKILMVDRLGELASDMEEDEGDEDGIQK